MAFIYAELNLKKSCIREYKNESQNSEKKEGNKSSEKVKRFKGIKKIWKIRNSEKMK